MILFDGVKFVYFIGLKGAGVSGLAQLVKARGIKVAGWDVGEPFFTDAILKRARIKVGLKLPKLIKVKPDLVVYSQAYAAPEHPVRLAFAKLKVPQVSYAEAVAALFNASYGILITGSHGKSTTTALTGHILAEAGLKPSILVGTEMLNYQSNALVGQGPYFVLEGDEYRQAFMAYRPKILVILNIDWDHPDHFVTAADYDQAFVDLLKNQAKTTLVLIPDESPKLIALAQQSGLKYKTFGPKAVPLQLTLNLVGEHNRANSAAGLAVANQLALTPQQALAGLKSFKGTRRRLEPKGVNLGWQCYDDYAHHPTEIAASLKALRTLAGLRPIWVVFQPHTFSRTAVFMADFATSLMIADQVILLPIYGSAREVAGEASSEALAKLIGPTARLIKTVRELPALLAKMPNKGILVTMGAGDVWRAYDFFD